jgi:predicted NAD-dependent protein-ADP-ribosyltransferase YbiA (DUF1768 family)
MLYILTNKMSQNAPFRELLLKTKQNTLLECTRDDFWGEGKTGNGQNTLGNLLMLVRERWQDQQKWPLLIEALKNKVISNIPGLIRNV